MKHGFAQRLLVTLLAALMLLGVSPLGALAAESESGRESVYEAQPLPETEVVETGTEAETESETEPAAETETETAAESEAEDGGQTPDANDAAPLEAAPAKVGSVHVIVENTTYKVADGAPWEGVLVDAWVDLTEESTMMSCVAEALEGAGYTQEGASAGYITEVNGLKGASVTIGEEKYEYAGWMGTLNDWFANEGFNAFTVKAGKLADKDEIRMMYSLTMGEDIGGSWSNTDKTVKALTVSAGALDPAFDKDTHSYTLVVPEGTTGVIVTPTASNKNYQVRASVGGTEYKRTQTIPVTDGAVITVKCGDPAWPSMNANTGEAQVYTLTVQVGERVKTADVTIRAQAAGAYLCGFDETQTVAADLAESYGYTDSVDGVSALDALVRAHELVFGEAYTKGTAKDYLIVSDYGYVTTLFGEKTGNNGFFINEGYPNDGTESTYGGYNGTLVTTQEIKNGDVLDFFIYQDSYCLDYYTWVSAPSAVGAGQRFKVTVTGLYAMEGYRYKTPAELKAAAKAIDGGVTLVWIDEATGAATKAELLVDEDEPECTDEDGEAYVTAPKTTGRYLLAAAGNEDEDVYVLMNPCVVNVAEAPKSITVEYVGDRMMGGQLVGSQGDTFRFRALDPDGNETPVRWSTSSSWLGTLDADTGVFTVTSTLSTGGASYLYITAASTLDASVKKQQSFSLTGYEIGTYYQNQTVRLSEDGQTAKTSSFSGGVNGWNVWSWDIPAGVAEPDSDPGSGSSIKFNCLRPGVFTARVAVKGFEDTMNSTATITVTGVAVEDTEGVRGKRYVELSRDDPAPTAQLTAYVGEGLTVASWSSADETIASVDENGLVTAHKVGTTLITATDDKGTKGGIRIVVTDADTPYFEALELLTTAVNGWKAGVTFQPTTLEYSVAIKSYSTSTLTLQATTLYDTKKYTATASYTDVNGEKASVAVNSGKITSLTNIAFESSDVTITLADRNDAANKTEYVLHVTRPRDTTKAIKATTGIVLVPDGRALVSAKYKDKAEGTMFQLDADGEPTTKTGVATGVYGYETYLLNGTEKFALTLTSSTAYAHLRWSADGGTSWTELPQGGGVTGLCGFDKDGKAEILVQIIDDTSYVKNKKAGQDGFALGEGETAVEYRVKVVSVSSSVKDAQLLTAECGAGDWYPTFDPEKNSFTILVPNGTTTAELRYTAVKGAAVAIGKNAQTPDADGVYTLTLKTSAQSITVTSADGLVNSYSFKLTARSKYDVPDRVVDYLCIGSQYTNGGGWGGFGINPEATLAGSLKSVGNFGGYITYYYEKAIEDDPNNLYGIDFYVYGNSSENNQASMAEAGQVYVSQDGVNWYALAGSEHYEDKAIWDYTISYVKGADGKSYWTDNQGNSMKNSAPAWPSSSLYYLNDVGAQDSYRFTGVLLKSQEDGTVMGSGTTSSFVAAARFGYADYYANGTLGTDVNPYVEKPTCSNGFDLAWAVDSAGNPVKLDSVHYIRVATASNIWAGAFNEKSTEVTCVIRTTAQSAPVGRTAEPTSVTLSDGSGSSKTVELAGGKSVYTVSAGGMRSVSVTVNGTDANANVYVNNQRVGAGEASSALSIPEGGTKLVRVIVQSGNGEPAVLLLKLVDGMDEQEVAAIGAVEALIDAIGTVTLESGEKIDAARSAYDALSAAQQALVGNYETLKKAEADYALLGYEKVYKETLDYIAALGTPGVGSVGGEWAVIALARSGRSVDAGYYTAAMQYVLDKGDENDRLDEDKPTENARLILALTAIGRDASKIADCDLTAGLDEMAFAAKQGVNGPIWTLIALDSHGWPEAGDVTRAALVRAILDAQGTDGGWSLTGDGADPDVTGMALTALVPYYKNGDADVKAAVDKALACLSAMQDDNGCFASWGSANSESCAQVITALTALGIDPTADERFVKNGRNPLDALCAFASEGGGFAHLAGGERNAMATEQGCYALAAYFRFREGKTSLYDMSDVTLSAGDAVSDARALIDAIGTVDADSGEAISAARRAYDALEKAEKAQIKDGAETIRQAEDEYTEIVKAIEAVEKLIDQIGTVSIEDGRRVKMARSAFDKLPAASQKHVKNRAKLTAAEETLRQLERAAAVEALIEAIGEPEKVTKDKREAVEAARSAYDRLSAEERALVKNYDRLTAAERKLASLDPKGGTKVIGSGDTKLLLDGVTYMVDAEAAALMKRIAELRDNGGMDDEGILDAYRTYDAMSSELKAQVFNYDDLEALCTALGVRGHHDAKTGMKAEGLPWYVLLEVEAIDGGSEYETVAGSIGRNKLAGLWRIGFVNRLTGEPFVPYEDVTVRIEAPAHEGFEQFRIARLGSDGRVEYSKCAVENGWLSWLAADEGVYGFIGGEAEASGTLEPEEETAEPETASAPVETAPAEEPEAQTAQHSLLWLWIVIGVLALAVLIAAILLKKREREKQRAARH